MGCLESYEGRQALQRKRRPIRMRLLSISKASDGKHKYVAEFALDSGARRITKFGAHGMDDYTITHDAAQRDRYRKRHEKDLRGDPSRAGYLSYYLLWGPSTSLAQNISAYKEKFSL